MDIEAFLAEQAPRVDAFLDAHVPPVDEPPTALHEAMRHLLFPGGKRFRPALAIAAARAVGGDCERALPVAAAVELVHTYSLVHDDLPCMDDDALRRGRPTVHVAYGEANAVLAGDALLAEAFRVLLEAEGLPAEARVDAARELAVASSSRELVGGQAADLAAGGNLDEAGLAWIHERKTAALFRAAVVGGARVAGADPATLQRLRRFALQAGVAFQIADDLLDAEEGEAPEAASLVTVLGAEAARCRAEALLEEALSELEPLGEPAEPLRGVGTAGRAEEALSDRTSEPAGKALLPGIDSPEDLRRLTPEQVSQVTGELRQEIVERISRTGGHLASSLGAVELLTGLHYVFDTPRDRLVLDVGHQGYAHKMLTGRREGFDDIGRAGGIGKFLRRCESEHDHFGAGHAGTSISAALGIARGLEHQGTDNVAIAMIGDGGMTAGMAFEALNHAGDLRQKNLLVILNDNEMSIYPNVGALSSYLSRKLSAPMVRSIKRWTKEFLTSMPGDMVHWAQKAEESVKVFFSPGLLFEALGFKYVGPIQGHRVPVVLETLANAKKMLADGDGPILIHAITAKGRGYEPAERDPLKYHGPGPFEISSGKTAPSKPGPPKYQNVFAQTLIELAKEDPRIVAITAAMPDGTSLDQFGRAYPKRYYDVGIAEQHAVTFAAGLAAEGMKPVAAIYSTFLQRAYDQVVHDVCLQDLDVTFALDRAGLVGADGATHQGFYDLSYLRTLPNMVVMAPKDENELRHLLRTAVEHAGPAAIRYPRGAGWGVPLDADVKTLPIGESELLRDGEDALVVALGLPVHPAMEAAAELASEGMSVAVINARFVKPLDAERIVAMAKKTRAVVTVEEHVLQGGFGSAVLEALSAAGVEVPVRCLGVPDRLIEHGSPADIRAELRLDAPGIAQTVRELVAERGGAEPEGS